MQHDATKTSHQAFLARSRLRIDILSAGSRQNSCFVNFQPSAYLTSQFLPQQFAKLEVVSFTNLSRNTAFDQGQPYDCPSISLCPYHSEVMDHLACCFSIETQVEQSNLRC